jgi:hypothetical protein
MSFSLPHAARGLCLTLALFALPAGSALAAPAQQISGPTSYDFGTINVDQGGSYQDLWFQNNSDHEAYVDGAEISGPDAAAFRINNDGCRNQGTLWSGNSCSIQVVYDPSDGEDHDATLVLRAVDSADMVGQDYSVALTGRGGVLQVTASPDPLDFGTVEVGESAIRSVTLNNTGNQLFQSMVAIPVGGDVGAFRVLEDGCSMVMLAPGIGCKMTLRFEPYVADNFEAKLAIIGQGNPTLVTLRGVGREAAAVGTVAHLVKNARPAKKAAPKKTAAKKAAPKKAARVAFNWRRGMPAPYSRHRVDLGVAHCKGAPSCRVTVRAWFVTRAGSAATRTTRVQQTTWRLASGSRVSVKLPQLPKNSLRRLVVGLQTHASGLPKGVQRLNVRLIDGVRRGGAVFAAPAKR